MAKMSRSWSKDVHVRPPARTGGHARSFFHSHSRPNYKFNGCDGAIASMVKPKSSRIGPGTALIALIAGRAASMRFTPSRLCKRTHLCWSKGRCF